MQLDTLLYKNNAWVFEHDSIIEKFAASVVFVFGHTEALKSGEFIQSLRRLYSNAYLIGASSAGNIHGVDISQNEMVATALFLEKSSVHSSTVSFNQQSNVSDVASELINQLPHDGLKHVFVLSDGLHINGSELVKGINSISQGWSVTGGLAGDSDRFQETWVLSDDTVEQYRIAALGFYGDSLDISLGYFGGWNSFGSDRVITKSKANVLYELDGKPALDLYKKYLGEFAAELPASGLRFPLNIRETEHSLTVIRTLLAIDEDEKSITFAGDMPEGYIARLMKADLDDLIDGARNAALKIDQANTKTSLCLAISCVGRRIVMNQLAEEELEAVQDALGEHTQLTGFYSYGEIAPFKDQLQQCQLHNQTMTLTVIYEN